MVGDWLIDSLISNLGRNVVDKYEEEVEHNDEQDHPMQKAKTSGK